TTLANCQGGTINDLRYGNLFLSRHHHGSSGRGSPSGTYGENHSVVLTVPLMRTVIFTQHLILARPKDFLVQAVISTKTASLMPTALSSPSITCQQPSGALFTYGFD